MPRSNSKALHIGVQTNSIYEPNIYEKALEAFVAKGHTVTYQPNEFYICDVIIGPRCWRIDPSLKLGDDKTVEESLKRQLEMMEKGVRAIKYPKEIKDAK